jgi:nitroimidazol reductase NimA-like FMN-containing flavoprotein (pyridoxamine 5'-phosphate oxidase superfamily)
MGIPRNAIAYPAAAPVIGVVNTARMQAAPDIAKTARGIIDRNRYMVVATSDPSGQPWPSPVYFAHRDYREFFWVSDPDAAHSRNLRERREVGIVIFDSRAKLGSGQGVYISGVAHELPAHEVDEGIALISERSVGHGGTEWTAEDVREPSRHRLFHATAEAVYALDEHDHRIEVDLRSD